jgi:hypothetical protein
MRNLKLIGLLGVLSLGLWLELTGQHQPAAKPVASITLVAYTNVTMSNPDTNVICIPGRGTRLRAKMRLRNDGGGAIAYAAWGDWPFGWANAETDQGATNGDLAPRFTGGTVVLPSGSNILFRVYLPTNTVRWQCGFSVWTSSARENVRWKLIQTRPPPPLRPLRGFFYGLLLRLPPAKPGPEIEIKSELFEVGQTVRATNEMALHQRLDVP